MRNSIFFILTCFAFSFSLKSQCVINTQMYDIYTPRCSPVSTWCMAEASNSVRAAFDFDYAIRYPNAQQVITYNGYSSTRLFNCHGFTFIRTQGAQTVG